MNKKYYIFGAVFAILLSGLFSSCVIVAGTESDETLYNFEFVNNRILECNYTGYIDADDIISVKVYDNRGYYRYSSAFTSVSCRNSRVTFVLDRPLDNGWHVDIKFDDLFSIETYSVYYYE